MFLKKETKASIQRKKGMELQLQRETVKKRIRQLRGEMQALIDQAASADDLDRQILSLEYEEKKADLNTETTHFNELSKLISRLNGVAMVYERQEIFNHVAAVAENIDVQSALEAEDQMAAHRAVMREETDALDDLLRDGNAAADGLVESAEFTRLVHDAQLRKAAAPREEANLTGAEAVCG